MAVTIHSAAKIPFTVVHMKCAYGIDTDNPVKFPQGASITLFRTDIIPGGEKVTGIQANADSLSFIYPFDDVRQMFEAITETTALACSIFEQNGNEWGHRIHCSIEGIHNPRQACLDPGSRMRTGMQYQIGNPQESRSFQFFYKSLYRLMIDTIMWGSQIDEVAVMRQDGMYLMIALRLTKQRLIPARQWLGFPSIAVLQKNLNSPAVCTRTPFERPVDSPCDRHVSAGKQSTHGAILLFR
jgi:hypothetical protein